MSRFTNWDEAANRPKQTAGAMFVVGASGGGIVEYTVGSRNLYVALLVGIGCGLLLVLISFRAMGKPSEPARSTRALALTTALPAALGTMILVIAVWMDKSAIALLSLPFFAISLLSVTAGSLVRRRKDRGQRPRSDDH